MVLPRCTKKMPLLFRSWRSLTKMEVDRSRPKRNRQGAKERMPLRDKCPTSSSFMGQGRGEVSGFEDFG